MNTRFCGFFFIVSVKDKDYPLKTRACPHQFRQINTLAAREGKPLNDTLREICMKAVEAAVAQEDAKSAKNVK